MVFRHNNSRNEEAFKQGWLKNDVKNGILYLELIIRRTTCI